MEQKIKDIIALHPEKETQILDLYNSIKEINDAVRLIEYALKINMDLKKAEEFFLNIYKNENK